MASTQPSKKPESSLEALKLLYEGNQRFSKDQANQEAANHQDRRIQLLESQNPFAIILSCSDSRVPSEIIFDQGLGDLFVIRVAGNIVAPSIIGSVEFAVATFGTPLVVVMGHSQCGAVSAALDVVQAGKNFTSENIRDIVERISPSIRPLVESCNAKPAKATREELMSCCVRANILASVNQLQHSSRIIEKLIKENKLMVVGAEYLLETGVVHFLDANQISADLPLFQ